MVPVGKEAITEAKNRGPWIQTYTGRAFYPLNPRSEEIELEDIAHALSMQCRFTGHVKEFYSVAEHCVRVSWMIDALAGYSMISNNHHVSAFWGLMHDAPEAYLVDVARPIKHMDLMKPYRDIEKRTMDVICDRFGMSHREPPEVKESDRILLAVEARDLMSPLRPGWESWTKYLEMAPKDYYIKPLSQKQAKEAFIARFITLSGAAAGGQQ